MNTDKQPAAARVLVVDDEPDILELLELALVRMGLLVEHATNVREALQQIDSKHYDLCLTDMRLPDGDGLEVVRHIVARNMNLPVAVITAHGNMENAISVLKAGAFDYLSKPVALEQLRALVKAALKLPQPSAAVRDGVRTLLGRSPAMEKVRDLIERVARSQAPVHISGESGSGKELAARLIVEKSARRDQPFIAVNCGAIPETLMESEFFGYRKGAFTGAEHDRDGFFQAANGGTLFLDEVADLPLSMQVKLLRVIQEKKVRKVGATQEETVDVRIISATHHALAERVQQGKFRQDLYYRLNVIALHMPPLREMCDDIADIANQLLARLRNGVAVEFAPESLQALCHHNFPGNVRELENIIERALALCSDGIITPTDLQLAPADTGVPAGKPDAVGKIPLTDYLDGIERAAILDALQQTGFNRTAAAKILGITFRALRYRMGRLGINGKDE
ncbi:MAG: sigma-54-dependent Fis family transcriptional regulator [Betaproteobacteria bacterium]|nr:sigma-54-dependent Fis family transcriptional regulator [Betaproteobacteria bacterium]